jgi:MFS family permease
LVGSGMLPQLLLRDILTELQMIANFFYGVGSMLIFAMATTMLTEFMPQRSSSGVALNNFVRNIFSCVGGIVGAPLIASIGNGWLFTILGLWALSSASVIWAMRSKCCAQFTRPCLTALEFGPRWRIRMDEELGE